MKNFLQVLRKKLRKILPKWMNFQNLIFISVIVAFTIIVFWSESISKYFETIRLRDVGITPTPSKLPYIPTQLPSEWLSSADQTNGIVLGAIIILFTILIGTAVMVLRDSSE
jgi:hypothetical protein